MLLNTVICALFLLLLYPVTYAAVSILIMGYLIAASSIEKVFRLVYKPIPKQPIWYLPETKNIQQRYFR
jgi:hypothetical protein